MQQTDYQNVIPITYYIACNNRNGAIDFLKSYGINVPEPKTPAQIAHGLKYIAKNGSDKDFIRIIALHPDKDILETNHDSNFNNEQKSEKVPIPLPENQQQNNQSQIENKPAEPIINVKVAYTLLGSAITLTIVGAIAWGVKNIKP